MARKFAQIKIAVWKDDDFRSLSLGEQWLYEALISQPDLSLAGTIMLRPSRWARLANDVTTNQVEAWLRSLEARRYVLIDWDTEELMIRTFIKHDGSGGNQWFIRGVRSAIEALESEVLRDHADQALRVRLSDGTSDDPPDEPSHEASHVASHEASDGDKLEPVTGNRETTTDDTTESSSVVDLAHALAEHLAATANFTSTRRGWVRGTEANILAERLPELEQCIRDGLTQEQAIRRLTGRPPTDNTPHDRPKKHANPTCPTCHGEGIAPTDDNGVTRFAHCVCLAADPYEPPLATVHNLRGTA
jgi:hypothetical protein